MEKPFLFESENGQIFLEKSLWYMKILLSLPCDCFNYREYYFCDFCSFHVSL